MYTIRGMNLHYAVLWKTYSYENVGKIFITVISKLGYCSQVDFLFIVHGTLYKVLSSETYFWELELKFKCIKSIRCTAKKAFSAPSPVSYSFFLAISVYMACSCLVISSF